MDGNGQGCEFTVNDALDALGFGFFQARLSVFVAIGRMTSGFTIIGLSILAPAVLCDLHLTRLENGFIAVAFGIGGMCGSPVVGKFMDKYGRKKGMLFGRIFLSVSAVAMAPSPNLLLLTLFSFFLGFGFAANQQVCSFYCEFLPSKHRGRAFQFIEVGFVIGGVAIAGLAIVTMKYLNWHWFWGCLSGLLFLSLLSFLLVPESVHFLLASGQANKAMETLKGIAKTNRKTLPPGQLVLQVTKEKQETSSPDNTEESRLLAGRQLERRGELRDLFSTWRGGVTTVLLSVIFFITLASVFGIDLMIPEMLRIIRQHHSGNYTSSNVVPCIERFPNQSECVVLTEDDYTQLMWVTAGEVPGYVAGSLMIDKCGRKVTISILSLVSATAFFLMYICPILKELLLLMVFAIRGSTIATLISAKVYASEVYPARLRSTGFGVALLVGSVGMAVTPVASQVLVAKSVRAVEGAYGGLAIICAICALLLPVETRRRGMQEGLLYGTPDHDTVQEK